MHDEAPRVEDTDWAQILALYQVLERLSPNPMVALNRAIAAAMVHGPRTGLEMLQALERDGGAQLHHRLDAVRAHLLEMDGNHARALDHYRAAAERATSIPERDYLLARATRAASRIATASPA